MMAMKVKVPRRQIGRRGGRESWKARLDRRAVKPAAKLPSEELPKDQRNRALDAIEKLGSRVTTADVATEAGMTVNEAEKATKALAEDTGADLAVSEAGDVVYAFRSDAKARLAGKSFAVRMEPAVEKAKGVSLYLVRVSFGAALVSSVVVVYTSIIALLSSGGRGEDRDDGRDRGPGIAIYRPITPGDMFLFFDPYPRPMYYHYYYGHDGGDEPREMGFLESIFSFVFGDGDPNEGYEEERWGTIAQVIRQNGGVVTAEQLAPYLDAPADWQPTGSSEGPSASDENFVLPALLRFDGTPEVDDSGNLLYRFPDLQKTASTRSNSFAEQPDYPLENRWPFSIAPPGNKFLAGLLGIANFIGVIMLDGMLKSPSSGGALPLVRVLMPYLKAYAVAFFAIPLLRFLEITRRNIKVDRRNQARLRAAELLSSSESPELRQKLASARQAATRQEVVGRDSSIVYDTSRPESENELDGFDRRLNQR